MKRALVTITMLFLFLTQASASVPPYSDPNRQTMWNNLTDSIHTFGQTPQKARITKNKLHYQRALTRYKNIQKAAYQHKQH